MSVLSKGIDLFSQRPEGVNRLDWLANQLLALAIEAKSLTFRIVSPKEREYLFECSDSVDLLSSTNPTPLRLFRTLLARFAKMAQEENGVEFYPYRGTVHFTRKGPTGLVRVKVEFVNSGLEQSLSLTPSLSLAAS